MIRNLIVLFVVVILLVLGLASYHLSSVRGITVQPVPIYHWEDSTATVREAVASGTFTRLRERRFNAGYTESAHWFRFRLKSNRQPADFSFEIRNHTIDRVEFFELKNGSLRSLGQTGSRLPFTQRPSPTKTFAYPIHLEANQQADYYLRLDKRFENLATELKLWRTSDFEDKEQREYLLWGMASGLAGLIVTLAFLFYAITRDPVYGWYGLYTFGLSLRQLADTGLGFQFIWPELPALNHPDAVIEALWIYIPAMLQFQQHFLQLRTTAKRLFWAMQVLKYAFCVVLILLVVSQLTGLTQSYSGSYRLITLVHTILANVAFVLFIIVVFVGLRSKDSVKRLYAIGFGIQIVGQLFIYAQNLMRYRADGIFFVDAYLIVVVNFFIDIVIFAYLLAYRYRKSLDEQRRLEISLAQTQQQTNAAIIDVLESERQQVGDLLRTDVGGRLTQTRALLADAAPAPLLTEAVALIDQTDDCLEQIVRDSPPPDLLQKGLPTALAELVAQRNEAGNVRLHFRHDTDGSVPVFSAAQTRQLYRIANELTNNLTKHAQATEGSIVLRQQTAGWQLTVSDNGQGFDPAQDQDGIGLKNLLARAQTLDATVQLESGQTGTTIRVRG
ncbi:7TM-DISM domain-containing protein [Persicitalea sp.]|uniref:sensor histidine kinase n=1 Tax=Persicitalea sp. TaxID=3100273 RepID=UPI003593FFBA